MWLPKDERSLLAGYYILLGEVNWEKWHKASTVSRLLSGRRYSTLPIYGEHDPEDNFVGPSVDPISDTEEYGAMLRRVRVANELLAERGLVLIAAHQSQSDVFGVKLTIKGYDLGRSLSKWFTRSGLWFREYKDHWLWLIMAFFGGALCNQLLDAMFRKKF